MEIEQATGASKRSAISIGTMGVSPDRNKRKGANERAGDGGATLTKSMMDGYMDESINQCIWMERR